MAQDDDAPLSDAEKVRVAADFILHAPPGEFNEVFNDVRVLLNNDALLKDGASGAFSQYNKDQLTPVKVEGSELFGLITEHNDLGGGRFTDARSKQSFKYDHLRKEASEYEAWDPDTQMEALRSAVEAEVTEYCLQHYRHGGHHQAAGVQRPCQPGHLHPGSLHQAVIIQLSPPQRSVGRQPGPGETFPPGAGRRRTVC